MATLEVLRFPDERLRKIATPVEKITPETEHIIKDMFGLMIFQKLSKKISLIIKT